MRILTLFVLLLTLTLAPVARSRTPLVVASIEPIAMLLRDVLGEDATVQTFLLPNQTPHDSAFTPGQAQLIQKADLVVWLGAEAEPALARLLKRTAKAQLAMLSVDGIERRQMVSSDDDHHGHDHDHDHDHDHGGALDPHLWLSPVNMQKLAEALVSQQELAGADQARLQQQLDNFVAQLEQQHQRLKARLAPVANRAYVSHHDAWGYFADSFGLRPVIPVSNSTALSPGSRRFVELVKQMEAQQVRCVMAEPESSYALLQRLCRGECRVMEADPLGRDLGAVGYRDLLEALAQRFAVCLGAPLTAAE